MTTKAQLKSRLARSARKKFGTSTSARARAYVYGPMRRAFKSCRKRKA